MKQREDRWWNFPMVFCLLAALMMTAFKIESTNWTENLNIFKWLIFIGFILGLGFGYSYFSAFKTRLMILIYSIIIIPWAFTFSYGQELSWLERLSNLSGRFGNSLGLFFNNIKVEDPLLFLSFLALVLWISSFLAGFLMTRNGKPWLPLIVFAITIFTTEFYYINQKNLYSAAFVIFCLLVLSQSNFLQASKKWRKNGTLIEFETGYHIGRSALIGGIILVFLAWNVSGLVSAFQDGSSQRKQLSGIFSSIRNQFIKITAPLQGPLILTQDFYGDSIGLGTGSELSDSVAFEVEVDQFIPLGSRYYWRARTYDLFEDYRWNNSISNEINFVANSPPLTYPETQSFPERTFTFNTKINLGLLYTPAYPLNVNRSTTAIANTLPGDTLDLVSLLVNRPIFAGETYQVFARIPDPTLEEMRNASEQYPDWISSKYLQLPENFSERIRQLAESITTDENNVYDKTAAVTRYLRNTIEYQEQIPEPPKNVDPIDWFLFDLKSGFCNYYASAEVLMLRSIGIPARMVFGYAQGESDDSETFFRVTFKQSHAWPEVFFPGIGWVEFEPTSAQPNLTRLSGQNFNNLNGEGGVFDRPDAGLDRSLIEDPFIDETDSAIQDIELADQTSTFSITNIIPLLIIILIIDLFALFSIRNKRLGRSFIPPVEFENFLEKHGWKAPNWLKRWSFYLKLSLIDRAFASIAWSFFILRKPLKTAITPAELVAEFSDLIPELKEPASQLLFEYQKAIYSPYLPDIGLMQKLSKELLNKTILYRLKNIFISEEEPEIESSIH